MNIIPKFQSGGGISTSFTVYQSTQVPQQQNQQASKTSDRESVSVKDSSKISESEDTTKGKLTEKDVYQMIKDVDGLPNEMQRIIKQLQNTMSIANLSGVTDTSALSNAYLSSLYKLKIANQNKQRFDESITKAKENGSLGEVAITLDGKIMVQNKEGAITSVSLEEFQKNPGQYSALTNSNIAWFRKYSPKFAFASSDDAFEIIDNGIGYESFQALLDKAKGDLGKQRYEETGIVGKEALAGLKALQGLSDEQKQKYILGALEGKYKYTTTTDSNAQNIQSLITYLSNILPKRARVWAAVKTGQPEQEAITNLVAMYLSKGLSSDSKYEVSYLGTDEKLKKSSSSSDGSTGNTKEGFWRQLQSGKGGEDQSLNIMVGNSSLSVDGKYYGTTPGLDENKSLLNYLKDSKLGYLIKDAKNITFGDQKITPESFKDIMVNSASGVSVVTLPITPDGKVNFDILKTYSKITNKLRQLGLQAGTQQYEKGKAALLKKVGLGYLVDASTGTVNTHYFGNFLVAEGVASSKAQTISNNEKQKLQLTDYIQDASKDDSLYDTVKSALSDKEHSYELDNNWISFNNDQLFKGNIYIPLNTNALNAFNADDNKVDESDAKTYEERQQIWSKRQNQQTTSAGEL